MRINQNNEKLTYSLQHELAGKWIFEPLGELSAIPHEEFLIRKDRFDRVKINVHLRN